MHEGLTYVSPESKGQHSVQFACHMRKPGGADLIRTTVTVHNVNAAEHVNVVSSLATPGQFNTHSTQA